MIFVIPAGTTFTRGDRMVRQAHHERSLILSLSKDAVSASSAVMS
jgi:hypothetical protein